MKLSKWGGAAALGLTVVAGHAEARVVIDVSEVGGNVITTGSGTVDLTGLSFSSSSLPQAGALFASAGSVSVGSSSPGDLYSGAIGPASFGAGGFIIPFERSGDLLGLFGSFAPAEILVPHGYVSGTSLLGSSTYVGQTFASLGLTPGTYLYTWGSGPTADSLTVKIGAAAIPEPRTWAMMLIGFAGLGYAGYRASRRNASTGLQA
jgi:hypothetical protein